MLIRKSGQVLIRVIQASLREHVVSVRLSGETLARKLDFASTTPYQAVSAGRSGNGNSSSALPITARKR